METHRGNPLSARDEQGRHEERASASQMKKTFRLLLPVCAIIGAVAAGRIVADSTQITTTKTTTADGVTAQLVTTNDALPPIEGYDTSYKARVRITAGGKAAIDEALTSAKGVFLTIDGPSIAMAGGHATVTLDATASNNAVTRYVFTQGADGAFTEKHGAKPATATLPDTTFSIERSATNGAISALVLANETTQLTKPPTLTIVRNGVPRTYATALMDKDQVLAAFEGPAILDIDGSGAKSLVFSAISDGASCCVTTELFAFDTAGGRYRRYDHFWSYMKNEPTLKRFGNDTIVTFAARDLDFSQRAGAAVAYNGIAPIQLWQFRKHAFVDVTRAYPDAILADTKEQLKEFAAAKGDPFIVKAACAAYIADEWLLGRRAAEGEIFRTTCKSVSAADRATIDEALEAGAYTKNI
jgi:hypothetical protein